MEQFRLLIAIGLSFLIFLAWGHFFADKPPVQKPAEQQASVQAPQAPAAGQEATPPVERIVTPSPVLPAAPGATEQSARQARLITVKAPLYAVTISEKGAIFKSFVLSGYREKVARNSKPKELIPESIAPGTLRLDFKGKTISGLNQAVFSCDAPVDAINVASEPQSLSFSWASPQGVVVEKRYHFVPESYQIGMTITVKNASGQPIKDQLILSLVMAASENEDRYGFSGPSALIDDKLEQVKTKKIKENPTFTGQLKWLAVQDRYFLTSIIPKTTVNATMQIVAEPDNIIETRYVQPESTILPGTQQSFEYFLFLGPKSVRVLRTINYDMDKAVDFGWFDFIAKPCLWLMNFLYRFIPNYGLAIIILTILIKVLLWPLGNKSYKSMNEMKKLQPIMAEIREKYKNDKQKMNQEVMALYKTYKINPMGGCLPMVAQIPVFFALYRMLYEAIELRHAPFFGWINDLSAPDRLFNFNFSIPLMEPPYGIPVLTIIMGASMLLQQKMTPAAGDPMQQKMMMLMPVVFTFIFINFSSGLVLYWLTNNILSIAQQYYISKKAA